MIDRIKSLMEYYHLSPAQFADKIGFQRSALSHVLSGRNKASLDFVLKVKNAFPDLNLEWLTLGEGNKFLNPEKMPKLSDEDVLRIDFDTAKEEVDRSEEAKIEEENASKYGESARITDNYKSDRSKSSINQQFKADKFIKKIILLYDDGSFSEHVPEK